MTTDTNLINAPHCLELFLIYFCFQKETLIKIFSIKGKPCNSLKRYNFSILIYHLIGIWSARCYVQVVPYPILASSCKVLLFQLELDITFEMASVTMDDTKQLLKAASTSVCSHYPLGLETYSDFLILLRCRNTP